MRLHWYLGGSQRGKKLRPDGPDQTRATGTTELPFIRQEGGKPGGLKLSSRAIAKPISDKEAGGGNAYDMTVQSQRGCTEAQQGAVLLKVSNIPKRRLEQVRRKNCAARPEWPYSGEETRSVVLEKRHQGGYPWPRNSGGPKVPTTGQNIMKTHAAFSRPFTRRREKKRLKRAGRGGKGINQFRTGPWEKGRSKGFQKGLWQRILG